MVSSQFMQDWRRMTAEGVEFTPEDIVRLNALSVRARRSRTAARDVHLPRLAFMPRDSWWREPIVLREPSIAHDLWLEAAERWIDTSTERGFLFLHAYALSRRVEALPDADRPKAVVKAVFRFAARRLCRFTRHQLRAAVEYALFGSDWTAGEAAKAGREKEDAKAEDADTSPPSTAIGLLTDCRMLRLPITLEDAKRMTASELTEAVNRAWDLDGKFDPKSTHARAFGEYVRAREEIRKRARHG
ncbi:MAG: hypothetical protein IJG84_21340 [Kiritimatiellae bacterium]|nr:hypothetical protein [Kiritimatiellia bacterium]